MGEGWELEEVAYHGGLLWVVIVHTGTKERKQFSMDADQVSNLPNKYLVANELTPQEPHECGK